MKHSLYILVSIVSLSIFSCTPKNELGLNEKASINSLGDLPENPLLLNAITSSIHPKDSSVTVLYGNDPAYNYAKVSGDGNYPVGAVLYGVTWQLQADEQWFGANVPESIRTVERIEFLSNNKIEYGSYDNTGLKQAEPYNKEERIHRITAMKMAVSP
ncbi:hypothetical protein [Chitinophaga sp.]|uniref:hypothetical protein n=1 Tax=Chitinophaga sp. TaxID=1869181 RepID=UPI0031DFDC31